MWIRASALCTVLGYSVHGFAQAPSYVDVNGLHAAAETLIAVPDRPGRLRDVTFTTPAVQAQWRLPPDPNNPNQPAPGARVLLPQGYSQEPNKRYPVLYLLHGGWGARSDWTHASDPGVDQNTVTGAAETLTWSYPVIVVMPEGGQAGWYTDWHVRGYKDTPRFETFHIQQLIPWVDANFRTLGRREGRAIAGLSMGGFGAIKYAARYPQLFVAAASFSGALDTTAEAQKFVIWQSGIGFGANANAIFGPFNNSWPWEHDGMELNYRAHNPVDLAGNLRGMRLAIYAGNKEAELLGLAETFRNALQRAGVTCQDHGTSCADPPVLGECTPVRVAPTPVGAECTWREVCCGAHDFTAWNLDLANWLPALMDVFAHPPPPPATFSYKSADPVYGAYDWTVRMTRAVREFSTLHVTSAQTFTVVGSGSAQVTSGPVFTPGAGYSVRISDYRGVSNISLRADASGRITTPNVYLGPDNPYPAYTYSGGATYSAQVEITRQ